MSFAKVGDIAGNNLLKSSADKILWPWPPRGLVLALASVMLSSNLSCFDNLAVICSLKYHKLKVKIIVSVKEN